MKPIANPTLSALMLTALAPLAAAQSTWSDDFNRPDAATLGPAWTNMNGSFGINSNRGYSTTGPDHAWTMHNSAAGAYAGFRVSLDFLPVVQPPPLHYVGLGIGMSANWTGIFIRVQDNTGDGLYDRVFFHAGVNAGAGWGSPSFFNLAVPTLSGRMTCYFTNNGDVANLDIDRNFDGVIDEHFQSAGILASGMTLGTGLAIGCFAKPAFDNWTADDGSLPPPSTYCTSSTTSNGCNPAIAYSGTPSVGASSGFSLTCSNVEGQKSAIFFYGASGAVATPWATGSTSFLCVKAPTQRLPPQSSGGTLFACDGALSMDLLAFLAAHPSALGQPIQAGQQLHAQAWFRDPPAPKTTNLSNALAITLVP